MFSKVINGEYKDWTVKQKLNGDLVVQWSPNKVIIDSTTVKSYKILDKGEAKSSLTKTVALGTMFGWMGALAGANSKSNGRTIVEITWKDDKKSIIDFDTTTYKAFLRVCPL